MWVEDCCSECEEVRGGEGGGWVAVVGAELAAGEEDGGRRGGDVDCDPEGVADDRGV